jgi:hypothetical protein
MSYGNPEWAKWVLGEEEGIEQIKFAYAPPNLISSLDKNSVSVTKTAFRPLTQLM